MSELGQAIGIAVAAILSAIVLWSARSAIVNHAFDWLKKLFVILILEALFRAVAIILDLNSVQTLGIYFLRPFFTFFPESLFVFALSCIGLVLTLELTLWVIGHHHLPKGHGSSHNKPNSH